MPNDSDKLVVELLRSGRAKTNADLCRLTGKSSSTVTYILRRLRQRGVLRPAGRRVAGPGRPGVLLRFDPGGYLAAVDVDITRAIVGLTDFAAHVVAQKTFDIRPNDTPERVLTGARRKLQAMLKSAGAGMAQVRGLGLGLRGYPSPEGVVECTVSPAWRGVAWRQLAARIFAHPVFVSHGQYRAVAEYRHGPMPAPRCMLLFNVADGVSARPVLDGRLYVGGTGMSGEIGHVVLQPGGPPCACGRLGCLEALVSGPAICRRIVADRSALKASPTLYRPLLRWAQAGAAAATVEELIRLAEGNEPRAGYARQLLEQVIDLSAQGLAMAVACFAPDRIVVDGYFFRTRADLLARLEQRTRERLGIDGHAMKPLEPSTLGESARIIGLALLAADELVKEGKVAG